MRSSFRLHLHERRVLRAVAGVNRRKVGIHTDVGDDHLQVVFGNDLANVAFHPADVIVGDLQASTGGRFDVNHKLAGIGPREERDPQQRKQRQADNEAPMMTTTVRPGRCSTFSTARS